MPIGRGKNPELESDEVTFTSPHGSLIYDGEY
jgi:hypothetical protein